jgi:hypothetical protein
VAPPAVTLETPNDGQRVRGDVEVRTTAVPVHVTRVLLSITASIHHVAPSRATARAASATASGSGKSSLHSKKASSIAGADSISR